MTENENRSWDDAFTIFLGGVGGPVATMLSNIFKSDADHSIDYILESDEAKLLQEEIRAAMHGHVANLHSLANQLGGKFISNESLSSVVAAKYRCMSCSSVLERNIQFKKKEDFTFFNVHSGEFIEENYPALCKQKISGTKKICKGKTKLISSALVKTPATGCDKFASKLEIRVKNSGRIVEKVIDYLLGRRDMVCDVYALRMNFHNERGCYECSNYLYGLEKNNKGIIVIQPRADDYINSKKERELFIHEGKKLVKKTISYRAGLHIPVDFCGTRIEIQLVTPDILEEINSCNELNHETYTEAMSRQRFFDLSNKMTKTQLRKLAKSSDERQAALQNCKYVLKRLCAYAPTH